MMIIIMIIHYQLSSSIIYNDIYFGIPVSPLQQYSCHLWANQPCLLREDRKTVLQCLPPVLGTPPETMAMTGRKHSSICVRRSFQVSFWKKWKKNIMKDGKWEDSVRDLGNHMIHSIPIILEDVSELGRWKYTRSKRNIFNSSIEKRRSVPTHRGIPGWSGCQQTLKSNCHSTKLGTILWPSYLILYGTSQPSGVELSVSW